MDVTVTTPGGTSATSPADQFTYVGRAGGLGPEPDERSDGWRHLGDDHRHELHRRHGGRLRHDAGDGLTVVSDTRSRPTARAGTGTVDVTVTTPGGTRPRRPPTSSPTVVRADGHGLSPTSGPAAGGTLVTITGTGFTGATAVDFGTTPATNLTVVSDTTITADSPAGTGVVNVTVTTPGWHVGHRRRPTSSPTWPRRWSRA